MKLLYCICWRDFGEKCIMTITHKYGFPQQPGRRTLVAKIKNIPIQSLTKCLNFAHAKSACGLSKREAFNEKT